MKICFKKNKDLETFLFRHGNYDQHISDAREIIREHSSSNTSLQRTNSSNSGNRRPAIVDWRVNGHYEQGKFPNEKMFLRNGLFC